MTTETHAWPPLGVVTHDDGTKDFYYTEPAPELVASSNTPIWDKAMFPEQSNRCLDLDCSQWGCWCKAMPPDEVFHCAHCPGAFDVLYQCNVYPNLCINCCGHQSCTQTWSNKVGR